MPLCLVPVQHAAAPSLASGRQNTMAPAKPGHQDNTAGRQARQDSPRLPQRSPVPAGSFRREGFRRKDDRRREAFCLTRTPYPLYHSRNNQHMAKCGCGQKLLECDYCHSGELICGSIQSHHGGNTTSCTGGATCTKCHVVLHVRCMDLHPHKLWHGQETDH